MKSVVAANLTPIVVEPILVGDELQTDIQGIKDVVDKFKDEVLCIISTTSCFAPRAIDRVEDIGKICKDNNFYHVVNNAYGL